MPNVGSNDHISITEDGTVNGISYIKWSNGRMMCWGSTTNQTASTAEGSLFISSGVTAVYPFPFTATPSIVCTPSNVANVIGARASGASNTQTTLVLIASSSGTISGLRWQAIGDWF